MPVFEKGMCPSELHIDIYVEVILETKWNHYDSDIRESWSHQVEPKSKSIHWEWTYFLRGIPVSTDIGVRGEPEKTRLWYRFYSVFIKGTSITIIPWIRHLLLRFPSIVHNSKPLVPFSFSMTFIRYKCSILKWFGTVYYFKGESHLRQAWDLHIQRRWGQSPHWRGSRVSNRKVTQKLCHCIVSAVTMLCIGLREQMWKTYHGRSYLSWIWKVVWSSPYRIGEAHVLKWH